MESQLGKALSDQWVQPFLSSAKATPGPGPKGKQPLSDLQSTGIVLKITLESRSQNLKLTNQWNYRATGPRPEQRRGHTNMAGVPGTPPGDTALPPHPACPGQGPSGEPPNSG